MKKIILIVVIVIMSLSTLSADTYKDNAYVVEQQKSHYIPYCSINDPYAIDELMWNQDEVSKLIGSKMELMSTAKAHWLTHGSMEGGLTYKEYMQISCGARMKISTISKGVHYARYGNSKLNIWFPDGRFIAIYLSDMRITTSFYKKKKPREDGLKKKEVIELLAKNSLKIATFVESEKGKRLAARGVAYLFKEVMKIFGKMLVVALAP